MNLRFWERFNQKGLTKEEKAEIEFLRMLTKETEKKKIVWSTSSLYFSTMKNETHVTIQRYRWYVDIRPPVGLGEVITISKEPITKSETNKRRVLLRLLDEIKAQEIQELNSSFTTESR